MSCRSKLRIDYTVLQNTGIKVLKYSDGEIEDKGRFKFMFLSTWKVKMKLMKVWILLLNEIGDIVLILKWEQEFDRQYQYGIVARTVGMVLLE